MMAASPDFSKGTWYTCNDFPPEIFIANRSSLMSEPATNTLLSHPPVGERSGSLNQKDDWLRCGTSHHFPS